MITFEGLPLEIRSMILKDCLENILSKHNEHSMTSGLVWHPGASRWGYQGPASSREADNLNAINNQIKIIRRRDAAALELQNIQRALPAGSYTIHEFHRLVGMELARAQEAGRALCAQIDTLDEESRRAGREEREMMQHGVQYDRHLYDEKLRRRRIKRIEHEMELSILEWTCNFLEMGLQVEEERWTKFEVHEWFCGWLTLEPPACGCPTARGMMAAYECK